MCPQQGGGLANGFYLGMSRRVMRWHHHVCSTGYKTAVACYHRTEGTTPFGDVPEGGIYRQLKIFPVYALKCHLSIV